MELLISESFQSLLDCKSHFLVMAGGKGGSKSEFAGRKLFYRCMTEGNHCFLAMRKVRRRVHSSVEKVMKSILDQNAVLYDENKTLGTLTFRNPKGAINTLVFDGLDDPEKIKSFKGATGSWIEEPTEWTKDELIKFDLSVREMAPGSYIQHMLTFNPDESQGPWLKEMFFLPGHEYHRGMHPSAHPRATVHISTIEDNPIAAFRDAYRQQLDEIQDDTLKEIYRHGRWAKLKGLIYSWDAIPLPTGISFDEICYGGDFGYTVNPAALVKVYRKADEYWLEEKLYQTGLTNDDLAETAKAAGVTSEDITVWDSAEQKSIAELQRRGLTVIGAEKGPGSVKTGIDLLKSRPIHIVEGSTNLIKETRSYKWKQDGNGRDLPVPVPYNDHLLDAARYVITYMEHQGGGLGFAYIDLGEG